MIRTRLLQILICIITTVAVAPGCTKSAAPTDSSAASSSETPIGRLGDAVMPRHYRLELTIDPSRDSFSGIVSIDIDVNAAGDSIWLHGKNLDVSEVYLLDGQSKRIDASYEERDSSGVALVSLASSVDVGPATLNFIYEGTFNTATNALFKITRGEDSYAATQFEAIAARQVFPGFDEPAFKVPFDLALVTRADDIAITTTPEASVAELGDGYVRHVFDTTRPLPTYLLAFAVGPYDLVDYGTIPPNSIRAHKLPLRGVVARGLGHRMEYALKNTGGLLTVLEEYFGTPYPYKKLDLIAVPESFGGAMENVGAITYDEYLMLMDEDSPLSQRRSYTSVHAHEMAHMWFGDLVTPIWWNDIWLNESFASWMENKVADAYWPEGEFDRETLKGALGAMAADSLATARQIREPVDQNSKIVSAFDRITYEKGGSVLAMLERYVGEDRFQAGVRLHMDRHADSTATAEDFIASLAEGSERFEIEGAFRSYLEQPGVPLLTVSVDCADPQHPKLDVTQTRYAPLGSDIDPAAGQWKIPMCVNFIVDGVQASSCTLLGERSQSIELDANSCPTQLHPNADGAGYYRFSMDDTGWDSLIAGASDLAAAEALALADSLDAAFRAGVVSPATYVTGLAKLANHDAWDVADAATGHFESIADIFEANELGPVEQAFRNIVGPRFARLTDASDSGSRLLRQRMQRFLIVAAKDQTMREPLARQAAARIGLEGEPDPSAADASELETILSVGVQDIGEAFFDLLLEQAIASEDPAFRASATGALARVEDPALVAKLQAALLAGEFKGTEFRRILFRQIVRVATTELTYAWVKKNDTAVIESIPGSFRSSVVPTLGSAFCTVERAVEWQSFIESHADMLAGYERDLAQTTESIRLCAALREARAADLITAFANYE